MARARHARKWDRDANRVLAELWRAGKRDEEIAIELRTTVNAIRVQRCKQGLVSSHRKRASIHDYSTGALLRERVRRGVWLPAGSWRHARGGPPRELDPAKAGGLFTF